MLFSSIVPADHSGFIALIRWAGERLGQIMERCAASVADIRDDLTVPPLPCWESPLLTRGRSLGTGPWRGYGWTDALMMCSSTCHLLHVTYSSLICLERPWTRLGTKAGANTAGCLWYGWCNSSQTHHTMRCPLSLWRAAHTLPLND